MSGRNPGAARWRMLALVSVAELLGMSVWFTASAAAPQLERMWGLSPSEAGWLTGAVQLGFVAGTALAAILNLADVLSSRWYFAAAALAASACNAALCLAGGLTEALAGRFLTGACLAAVYPPAMKMIATWFASRRGVAIGTVVGALTVGKAAPWLLRGLQERDFRVVVLAASGAAAVGALLIAAGWRDGPHPFTQRPFHWGLAMEVLRHRPTRLAIGGYLGHMWELYAMWTWIPAFLAASAATRPDPAGETHAHDLFAFLAIASGGPGCLWGGWMGDRAGREWTVNVAMAVSGGCSLLIGALFGAPAWLIGAAACLWGFFVVADSAQFSTLVTEVAPAHAVGTALTLQTSLGFLLTLATIQLVPWTASALGWGWAFPVLALGPAAGIAAIARLARLRRG